MTSKLDPYTWRRSTAV